MHDQQTGHLRDFFRWAGGEIWRGESETAVCACVVRLEVKGRLLFPPVALAQVHAVHPHKPVGTGNHLHHQGQLWIRQRECRTECVWSDSCPPEPTALRGAFLVSSPSETGRGPNCTGKVVFVSADAAAPTSLTHLNHPKVLFHRLVVHPQSNSYSK